MLALVYDMGVAAEDDFFPDPVVYETST